MPSRGVGDYLNNYYPLGRIALGVHDQQQGEPGSLVGGLIDGHNCGCLGTARYMQHQP